MKMDALTIAYAIRKRNQARAHAAAEELRAAEEPVDMETAEISLDELAKEDPKDARRARLERIFSSEG